MGRKIYMIILKILKGTPQVKFLNSTGFELETLNFTDTLLIDT